MIRNFRDRETQKLFERRRTRKLPREIERVARRRLLVVDAAEKLEDLRIPPGNRLEKLVGRRRGQYSIRINDRWRICFRWQRGDAFDVEIVDYH